MPGLPKVAIADRIEAALHSSGATVVHGSFTDDRGALPFRCKVRFQDGSERGYTLYFWTISHGGRSRSRTEYRIQAKLRSARDLDFENGTTLLMGYYAALADRVGAEEGNVAPAQMEAFAAWDPLVHLRVGASSSCQVPFAVLEAAYLKGASVALRRNQSGPPERVIAFRPENLASYMRAAAGGHNSVDLSQVLAQ